MLRLYHGSLWVLSFISSSAVQVRVLAPVRVDRFAVSMVDLRLEQAASLADQARLLGVVAQPPSAVSLLAAAPPQTGAAVPQEKQNFPIPNRSPNQAALAVVRVEPLRLRPALAPRLPRADTELRLLLPRLSALCDFACVDRDLDARLPLLLRREVFPRDVRVPVSPLRPLLADARLPRVLLPRVDAEREELRPEPSPLRAVVFLREERPSLRFWLLELVEEARRDLLPEFELLEDARRDLLPEFEPLLLAPRALLREARDALRCPRSPSAWFAVSRLTILLKLLRCPFAVVSWNSSASPCSSNFWNHSSHDSGSSDPAPLYPGKSMRRMPGSSPLPVRFTCDGAPPRCSAQRRIS
jgi:hypothetical protein